MADASDSKSDVGNHVWVQVPSPALYKNRVGQTTYSIFLEAKRSLDTGSRSTLKFRSVHYTRKAYSWTT